MDAWKRDILRARDVAVLDVACPECGAAVGERCWHEGRNGRVPARRPHAARIAASPSVTPAMQAAMVTYRKPAVAS